jgi:hypothetical protein
MPPTDKSLGDLAFETAAKGYRFIRGEKNLPPAERIYMQSVLDERREPITEQNFNADEIETLRNMIVRKYDAIKPQFEQEIAKSRTLAADLLKKAYAVKNDPNASRVYLDQYKAEAENIKGLSDYLASGQVNPTVVRVGKNLGVKPNIQYKDYDSSNAISKSLFNTLGRFTYDVDAGGNIAAKDEYDFNTVENAGPISLGLLLASPTSAAYKYGARVLPMGKGRPVNIRVNSMAPPKAKEPTNWFNRTATALGF